MYKQKGTGGARHGSAKAPQFRGGGRAFGPISRSHAHDLPKKVRVLALKHALSAKAKDANIIVLDKAEIAEPKTKLLLETLAKLGWSTTLIIGGETLQDNFVLAARNIPNLDVLPVQGINVYDIIRREKLVLTTAALDAIKTRKAAEAEAVAAKLKAEGAKPGVPDWLWPEPRGGFMGLAIEFKHGDGNPSKEQRERINALQAKGWCVVVCWTWEAAYRTVVGYAAMLRVQMP
jgi:50S ribosomal protein L4